MDGGVDVKYKPLSERTNARKKMRKARKKLLAETFDYSKYEGEFKAIMKKTGQSYETIRRQFDEFHSICPEGVMTRRKFLDLSKSALGEQSEFMAENLFRVFDCDDSGTLEFSEYMLAINATNMDSSEDKLNWMFDVFDNDGGGSISMSEIQFLVSGLCKMNGLELSEEELEEASKDIMTTIDEDGDGDVTKEEFVKNALKNDFIRSIIG